MDGYQSDIILIGTGADLPPNVTLVDPANGNDATGEKGNASKPFATGLAAEAVSVSGDIIVFTAGTHTSVNLGKDGITYHYQSGAIITNLVDTDVSTFSDEGKGDMQFKVTGFGHFIIDRQWNVNNWDTDIIRIRNASKVNFEAFKIEHTGNDGALFSSRTNGGEIHIEAEEISTGANGASARDNGKISVRARTLSISLSFGAQDGGILDLDIDVLNANIPHVFTSNIVTLFTRNDGKIFFNGVINYNPTAPSSISSIANCEQDGTVNKSLISLKGTFNVITGRWFGFTSGANATNNTIQFEGVVNLLPTASDVTTGGNTGARIVTKNLTVKSFSATRTTGLIPAHVMELHAENTTFILNSTEIGLGSEAIYTTAPNNAHLKSFFSNGTINTQVTNLIPNGLVDVGNPNIKE